MTRKDRSPAEPDEPFIARSREMIELLARARGIAPRPGPVLIIGESGTGKTRICQEIHWASTYSQGPFLKKGCGEFDDGTLAASIYGHTRGSFTSAVSDRPGLLKSANRGTLVLDDVDCLSLSGQACLLRFLDDGQYQPIGESGRFDRSDVRIVATTNKDLASLCKQNRFRSDLFYRLRRWRLHVPALRNRPDDVKALAEHFLSLVSDRNRMGKRFSPNALELLALLPWPSNTRGLRDAVEALALFGETRRLTIDVEDVARVLFDPEFGVCVDERTPDDLISRPGSLEAIFRLTGNNVSMTARIAGCARNTVYKMLRQHTADRSSAAASEDNELKIHVGIVPGDSQ